jgi:hypothetical protein
LRISQFVQKKFGLDDDQRCIITLWKYSNLCAIALYCRLRRKGKIKDNDLNGGFGGFWQQLQGKCDYQVVKLLLKEGVLKR